MMTLDLMGGSRDAGKVSLPPLSPPPKVGINIGIQMTGCLCIEARVRPSRMGLRGGR